MADGEAIGLLLVLTYATYVPPVVVTYTGIIYLNVLDRQFELSVLDRPFDGLTVLTRPSTG